MSGVTVPARGEGIRPRGPSTLPSGPTRPIMSGAAMQTSNSVQPSLIFLARSSSPTTSAPAALAASAMSPLANTTTRCVLPMPCGSTTEPRTIWSACLGSMPSRIAISTDLVELRVAELLQLFDGRRPAARASSGASGWRAPEIVWIVWSLALLSLHAIVVTRESADS